MEIRFTPWRSAYIQRAGKQRGCVFCKALKQKNDRKALIVHRGKHCFIILNAYPYNSGHIMVVPNQHLDELQKLPVAAAHEMMDLSQQVEAALRKIYKAPGINLGMNIGDCAGAGVHGHIHMHVLPRWTGDTNFMTTIAAARTLPETLDQTYQKLSKAF
ncbi:MAG: HIT domain-containing protein [Acidobacteriales bacterium]|nr:HIT domain-containing protein [Terriglobales bacterium]